MHPFSGIYSALQSKYAVIILAAISMLCSGLAFYHDNLLLLAIPFALVFGILAIIKPVWIVKLHFILLPASIEVDLPGGFGTDLPGEALLIYTTILTIAAYGYRPELISKKFWKNPVMLMLGAHFFWTLICAFPSVDILVSIKFTIAKSWYIITYIIAFMIFAPTPEEKIKLVKIGWPMLITLIWISLARHSVSGFAFDEANFAVMPYFRNHVDYACLISMQVPFVFLHWTRLSPQEKRKRMFILLTFILGIVFAYTRGAWLAVGVGLVSLPFFKRKLVFPLALIGFAAVLGVLAFFQHENNYLKLAPDYQKTVYAESLGDHITATFKGNDVSSAERIHRWVAAFYMWPERPFFGTGPGNFTPTYFQYTDYHFKTYVSANEERSTVHNYLLLMLAEQGIPGLIIFLILLATIIIQFQKACSIPNSYYRAFAYCWTIVGVIFFIQLMLSDLIESHKVGPYFFLSIAAVVSLNLVSKSELEKENSAPKLF